MASGLVRSLQRERDGNELHIFARNGDFDILQTKLRAGRRRSWLYDINEGDANGWTPLMCAAWRGNPDVSELLLRKGANVASTADGGVTALLVSSENGNLPETKMLIEAGSDVEASACTGFTALHTAADHEHADVTRVLIEAGANPDSRTLDGETPLFAGAQVGCLDVVRELLRAKADPLLTKTTGGSR